MNAPGPIIALQNAEDKANPADRKAYEGRVAALDRFNVEALQYLSTEDLLLAQAIAGHGGEWGIWKTPKDICPSKLPGCHRTINAAGPIDAVGSHCCFRQGQRHATKAKFHSTFALQLLPFHRRPIDLSQGRLPKDTRPVLLLD